MSSARTAVPATLPGLPRSLYAGYVYSYPHKSAWRPFAAPVPLRQLWQAEDRQHVFLYLHVPFCEHRCGFCNLFTLAGSSASSRSVEHSSLVDRYLNQLERQTDAVLEQTGSDTRFVRLAIGGGTPTFLEPAELERLLRLATDRCRVDMASVPSGIEASPATIDPDRLAVLRAFHIDRLSLGVQTFNDDESRRLGRPQQHRTVERAIDQVRAAGFPVLNLDLIYGIDGQTQASWLSSLHTALRWHPEELYLYPLYVRPLTGLGHRATGSASGDPASSPTGSLPAAALEICDPAWDAQRRDLYRAGRDLLLAAGYRQHSLRMFRRADAPDDSGPVFRCQADAMCGLGCGARSYTREVHWSTEFAVGRTAVRSILLDYLQRTPAQFATADYGIRLSPDDRRRRFLLLSLLQSTGVVRPEYQAHCGTEVLTDFPELTGLQQHGLADIDADRIVLTPAGMEQSDRIGPWLYSPEIRRLSDEGPAR